MPERDPRDVERIGGLERELEKARGEIADLKKVVEELLKRQRKAKRQANRFAREQGKPEGEKKKAGRKPGHDADWRQTPDQVDASVEARLDGCPFCGGEVCGAEELLQYVVDLPEVRAHVLRILTERGWCRRCRKHVRSSHPLQVSRAGGAAAVALGPRAMALATELKERQGVPYRDTASLFGRYFGLQVTHGALTQATVRLANKATPDYLELAEKVRTSPVVHTDDTGWFIGRQNAWMWVFATPEATLYVIDARRSAQVVLDVLGEEFGGTLVSDGLPALDALEYLRAQCVGHIIRRSRDMEAEQTRGAVRFPRHVKGLLQRAIELGKARPLLASSTYDEAVDEVRTELKALVSQDFSHPDNLRLAKHIFKHQDELLRFLEDPAVPPTNNLAEQELRGAVVVRKIGGCNRSPVNAFSHAVLASLAQTAHRQGRTLVPLVSNWMRLTGPPS